MESVSTFTKTLQLSSSGANHFRRNTATASTALALGSAPGVKAVRDGQRNHSSEKVTCRITHIYGEELYAHVRQLDTQPRSWTYMKVQPRKLEDYI
jgi:hypothetical protein